ncbi:MAG: 50S ribosomal protein L25 [Melioribacteraceae bacterium]|nr:50S ribosomal protein L25 [Melioribacteraceae bacterium]
MANLTLEAKKRELTTKGAVNQLRRDGYVPGVYYVKGDEPISFSVFETDLKPLVYTRESHLITLKLDGVKEDLRCVLKDIQFDPVSDRIVHVDFRGIKDDQVIDLEVPVRLRGTAEGVKQGGKLQVGVHKIKVECFPKDLLDHIELDITNLKIGESIHVRDLKYDNIKMLTNDSVVLVAVSSSRNVVAATEEEE